MCVTYRLREFNHGAETTLPPTRISLAATVRGKTSVTSVRSHNNSGFILALTLWVIATAGLAAAILAEWVSGAVENAQVLQDKVDSQLAFMNVRNELVCNT